jgi:DNA-binding NarL/FixJ family response regulator
MSSETVEVEKVLLIDDFPFRRASVASFIERWTGKANLALELATDCPTGDHDLKNLKLIIVCSGGLTTDDPKAVEKLAAIRAWSPSCPIVILSDNCDSGTVLGALRMGVQGFIPTQLDPLVAIEAMKFVFAGGVFFPPSALLDRSGPEASFSAEAGKNLTERQTQVVELLQRGKSNKVIARELGMQESTVKVHVRQIMRKLGVSNRTQAALHVRERIRLDGVSKSFDAEQPATPLPAMAIRASTHTSASRRYFP